MVASLKFLDLLYDLMYFFFENHGFIFYFKSVEQIPLYF